MGKHPELLYDLLRRHATGNTVQLLKGCVVYDLTSAVPLCSSVLNGDGTSKMPMHPPHKKIWAEWSCESNGETVRVGSVIETNLKLGESPLSDWFISPDAKRA